LGWSFDLLSQLGQGTYQHVVTVPLVMEYEDVLLRPTMVRVTPAAVHDVLDYVCVPPPCDKACIFYGDRV